VTVTVGGTPFSFTFAAGSTEAKVIDNVPTGTTLSAESEMDLSDGAWGTNGAGTPLCAVAAPAVIQSGDNTITMYARYPLVCRMSSDAAGQGAAITGTAPAYYTNGSPTPLPSATESYEADGTTMRFAGWALSDGGTPVISGSVPSTGVYKGKLTLWASYSECTVSISTGAAGTDPILAEDDTLALTAVPAGFPSAPAYTWSIESPAADAPVTVSASGVVSPVPGKSGSATVKVTATCGALTATATQNVSVAALSVTGAAAVEAMRLADGSKSISASVSGYTGTVEYAWSSSSTAVATVSPANTAAVTVAPLEGGITTLSVTATLKDGSGNVVKVIEKTIESAVLEVVLGGSGLPSGATDPIVLTAGSTETAALTAALRGISSGVTYAWSSSNNSVFTVSPENTSGTTVTPVAAGSDSVTATLTYRGVAVSASRNVSVAGIVFTTFPTSFAMGGATSSCSLAAEVQGFSGTVTWGTWTSGTAAVATVTGQTDSGTSSSVTLNALRGGKTRITVTATAGGVTLSAEKDICVLQLSLACGDSSFTPPSGLTDTSYKLTLIKGDPVATSITANLVGLPAAGVSYTWTPATSTKMDMTTSGTGNKTVRLAPVAAGNETVSVQATYDGESITRSVDVSVVGITLTGSSTHEFNSDPTGPATANQITLSATLENIELAALTSSGIGFSSSDTSIATLTPDTATSTGRDVDVTALKGGKVTVTVTAALGSTGKVFSAKKDITIIRLLVTDGSGTAVPDPADGNVSLAAGPVTLTAELEGLTTGVSYAWECTPASGSNISISSTSGPTTTVSGSVGTASGTVTASYGGSDYTKNIGFDVIYTVAYTNLNSLKSLLSSITGTDAAHPAKVNITGLTAVGLTDIKTALTACSSVFVDLSATTLPDGITSMYRGFKDCTNLVVSPVIPANVTDMYDCFRGCINLTTAPAIPDNVTRMYYCFAGCTSLTTAPVIPDSVTDMGDCFAGCTSLTDLSGLTIPASVTSMNSCFYNCESLTTAPAIPDSVTEMDCCFHGCKSLTTAPVIPAGITNMYDCFDDCTSLTTAPVIPDSVTSMNCCFYKCTNLTTAPAIPDSVTRMASCFYNCESLTTAPVIPDSVTEMDGCFSGCTSLSGTVTINASITDAVYWRDAFKNVDASKITKIYVPDAETKAALLQKNTQFSDAQVEWPVP